MGLELSEAKTKVTHITEGFAFLGYRIKRGIGTSGKMIPKVQIPEKAIKRFRQEMKWKLTYSSTVSVACYPRTVSKLQPPWEAINLPSRASP